VIIETVVDRWMMLLISGRSIRAFTST
jgi:hypothetical protein